MDVVAALADPVRREILSLLSRSRMSAGEVARRFEISRPAVSRHLRVLRECGLVLDEAVGRRRVYRLDPGPLAPLEAWLTRLRHARDRWPARLEALETEVYRTRRDRRESLPAGEAKRA